ncbi:MAG: glycoside hydrolase [Deltaproteobacteria bacterium]|nr:glycoside hydrolase [Deltaproteobacteria bacterium]
MGRLPIAFFWHMHQPYYRDPLSGEYSLPWVRLHALKGYYDMISLLEDYPAIRQTFNLVPSLLSQLNDYARGEARDVFLDHTRKPAEELSLEEKKFILVNFFMCHWETMVKPYPAYWALLQKRGRKVPEYRWDDLLHQFSSQDFRDLQVWFNLSWMGHRARERRESVRELLKKSRFFSEGDKAELLKVQLEILREVIPLYQAAQCRGQVEITTSPFYHPILPLLIDSKHASRAMPQAPLPIPFSYPKDAEAQVQKAVAFYRELFGKDPMGMWPSEGSVSPELIPIVHQAGIRWMASDEGVLFKSLPAGAGRAHLYQPYRVKYQGAEVIMVFRDRNLSDLIGFTYRKNPPQVSANDLLTHLYNIRNYLSGTQEDCLVFIALDGENPWEYYPDGGRDFLRSLYERLSHDFTLETVKVSEFLEAHPPRKTLDQLHTGSWIDQNFRIWIGSPEDNRAWECLRRTRAFLQRASEDDAKIPPEKVRLAWEQIYIAEGSDWFWWYGDDFTSDYDEEFDRLFRMHLRNVHLLLGSEVPDYLKTPIALPHEVKPAVEPLGLISPVLDGRVTHFYEWREAGYFPAKYFPGSMYRGEGFVSAIYYGFDLDRLYFRLDPILRNRNHLEGLQFCIHFLTRPQSQIAFPVKFSGEDENFFILHFLSEGKVQTQKRFSSICSGKIIELSIPFAELQFQAKEKIDFILTVKKEDLEVERYPRSGYLSMTIPDRDFAGTLWQV